MSDISITALPTVGMITLRGGFETLAAAVTAVTGCAQPGVRLSTRSGDVTAVWMSPDEMLVICDHASVAATVSALKAQLAGAFATVVDVSDARQVFDLTGENVEMLLCKLMPVDFAKLAPTEVRRTRMGQVPAAIWRHSGGFHVMCFRSVAEYAHELLVNARPAGA